MCCTIRATLISPGALAVAGCDDGHGLCVWAGSADGNSDVLKLA